VVVVVKPWWWWWSYLYSARPWRWDGLARVAEPVAEAFLLHSPERPIAVCHGTVKPSVAVSASGVLLTAGEALGASKPVAPAGLVFAVTAMLAHA
jgi:hypothetical protein